MDDDTRSPFLVQMLQGTLALFSDQRRVPTIAEALAMTKRAMARAALQVEGGNTQRAAELLEWSRRSVHRAAYDNSVAPPVDLWHGGGMNAPFDDQLFPFLRILWPAEPEPTFIEEYEAWFTGEIVPRATEENTQVVTLENCSSLTGLPSQNFRDALKGFAQTVGPVVEPFWAGTVIFAPNVPLAGWIAPVLNFAVKTVKLATTPNKVVTLATEYFNSAGVPLPADLSIN